MLVYSTRIEHRARVEVNKCRLRCLSSFSFFEFKNKQQLEKKIVKELLIDVSKRWNQLKHRDYTNIIHRNILSENVSLRDKIYVLVLHIMCISIVVYISHLRPCIVKEKWLNLLYWRIIISSARIIPLLNSFGIIFWECESYHTCIGIGNQSERWRNMIFLYMFLVLLKNCICGIGVNVLTKYFKFYIQEKSMVWWLDDWNSYEVNFRVQFVEFHQLFWRTLKHSTLVLSRLFHRYYELQKSRISCVIIVTK